MNPVTAYAGQNQGAQINVPARIAYKHIDWEESCWVMPPYAIFYPGPPPMPPPMYYTVQTPPSSVGKIRWVSGLF
jgi:hypothetical protein